MASFLVFGALELLQRGACPAAYFLQLSIFRNVEVALALASWSILPPPPPPHPPLPPDKVRCAKCPPVRLVCILEKIPGVEPALRPRLVRSFSCYTVQVALHPGFLSFDLL